MVTNKMKKYGDKKSKRNKMNNMVSDVFANKQETQLTQDAMNLTKLARNAAMGAPQNKYSKIFEYANNKKMM